MEFGGISNDYYTARDVAENHAAHSNERTIPNRDATDDGGIRTHVAQPSRSHPTGYAHTTGDARVVANNRIVADDRVR